MDISILRDKYETLLSSLSQPLPWGLVSVQKGDGEGLLVKVEGKGLVPLSSLADAPNAR